MKIPRKISRTDLEEIMGDYLAKRGVTDEFRAGYFAAMREAGYLKPGKPSWILDGAALRYLLPKPGEEI